MVVMGQHTVKVAWPVTVNGHRRAATKKDNEEENMHINTQRTSTNTHTHTKGGCRSAKY